MGLLLAVIVWALALMTCYLLYNANYWFPPAMSATAVSYDRQFMVTLAVTAVAFILAQGMLGYFIFKYRDRSSVARATYTHGNAKVEIGGIILTGVVFIALAIAGQRIWAQTHFAEPPPDTLRIEVTGQQFIWNIRYPGRDGKFGQTSPQFYETAGNIVGILPDDPDGKDDIIVQNQLVVPVNRSIELILRSKDVIHDFFLPPMRIKQDAVPGLAIPLRFTANKTGEFDVPCAELCGAGHYNMKARAQIVEPAEYEKWLSEQTLVFPVEEPQPAAAAPPASGQGQ